MTDQPSTESEQSSLRDRIPPVSEWGRKQDSQQLPRTPLEIMKSTMPDNKQRFRESLDKWAAPATVIERYDQAVEDISMIEDAIGALEVAEQRGPSERYMSADQVKSIYKVFGSGDFNQLIPENLRLSYEDAKKLHEDFIGIKPVDRGPVRSE